GHRDRERKHGLSRVAVAKNQRRLAFIQEPRHQLTHWRGRRAGECYQGLAFTRRASELPGRLLEIGTPRDVRGRGLELLAQRLAGTRTGQREAAPVQALPGPHHRELARHTAATVANGAQCEADLLSGPDQRDVEALTDQLWRLARRHVRQGLE